MRSIKTRRFIPKKDGLPALYFSQSLLQSSDGKLAIDQDQIALANSFFAFLSDTFLEKAATQSGARHALYAAAESFVSIHNEHLFTLQMHLRVDCHHRCIFQKTICLHYTNGGRTPIPTRLLAKGAHAPLKIEGDFAIDLITGRSHALSYPMAKAKTKG